MITSYTETTFMYTETKCSVYKVAINGSTHSQYVRVGSVDSMLLYKDRTRSARFDVVFGNRVCLQFKITVFMPLLRKGFV